MSQEIQTIEEIEATNKFIKRTNKLQKQIDNCDKIGVKSLKDKYQCKLDDLNNKAFINLKKRLDYEN